MQGVLLPTIITYLCLETWAEPVYGVRSSSFARTNGARTGRVGAQRGQSWAVTWSWRPTKENEKKKKITNT